jgi:hypothetical protein
MTAVHLFGVDLEATPEVRPAELRNAAADLARVLEAALMPQRYNEDRVYGGRGRSALTMLAQAIADLIEAADVIERAKR